MRYIITLALRRMRESYWAGGMNLMERQLVVSPSTGDHGSERGRGEEDAGRLGHGGESNVARRVQV